MDTTVSTHESLSPDVRAFLGREHGHFIDGQYEASADGAGFDTLDPSSGARIATVAQGGPDDVDRAVRAARSALRGDWGGASATVRGEQIHRLGVLVKEHATELAQLEALDNGKPVSIAEAVDVPLAANHFCYYAGWPTKVEGSVIPVGFPDMLCYTRQEPVGVCGQIVPWNFPLLMAAWKVAPALAAGCTVVLKPAEQTPLSALRLCELALEAGIPTGVLNVVTGNGATGAALVDHPGVDKIAFTGSTEVGREIGAKAGQALKRVTLELGGKSANVIMPDADLDAAIQGAFQAIYFNSGQSCNAGSRLFVPSDAFDRVVGDLAGIAKSTAPLPAFDPGAFVGPVVSAAQRDRVMSYIEAGLDDPDAELVAGGSSVDRDGYFVEPTLFTVTDDRPIIAREEIFGPVLVATPYDTFDEVVNRANNSAYGLAAGVWTRDLATAHRFAQAVQAGSVYVNTWSTTDAAAPFGGFKSSGIGREMGYSGLLAYLEEKTVWTNIA